MKVFIALALILASASAHAVDDGEKSNVFVEGRIVNGRAAVAGQFPYQVGLALEKTLISHWCSGSLIGTTWVLTAAQCTDGVISGTAYFGSITRAVAEVTSRFTASNIVQHSDYNSKTMANDISLIRVDALSYTADIQAIKLPIFEKQYLTYASYVGTSSGWGRTSETSSLSTTLNYVQNTVMGNPVCAFYYNYNPIINEDTLCVNHAAFCEGDFGGPLVITYGKKDKKELLLVGIMSFVSSEGCMADKPVGYVRLTSYLDWIKENSGIANEITN